ncbi:MAG: ROK family transcriptional regulator [Anaerolineae bacterium]
MPKPELLPGDVQLVRRLNRDAVLRLIRERGPISRTALARLARLTPVTAFSIVDELIGRELVRERGIGPSVGGRRPMLFEARTDAFAAIGINIRSSEVRGVLTQLDARPLATVVRAYDLNAGAPIVQLTVEVIRELIARSPLPIERLLGIGLAVPGLVDVARGVVVESQNWGWQELPLRAILAQQLELPIYLEEDDNALALGEGFFGAGRGVANAICIKVGRGMGAGIIINGRLYRGPDNTAGEVAHMMVDPEGPRCDCGNYGCLVRLVSAPAIAERAIKALKQGATSSLRAEVEGNLDRVNMAMVAHAANAGDAFACQIMMDVGRYLGIGIATLVNLLNPDLVIIGGGVSLVGAPLFEPIRQGVAIRALKTPGERVKIVPALLGVDAPAIGAAVLVMIEQGVLPT